MGDWKGDPSGFLHSSKKRQLTADGVSSLGNACGPKVNGYEPSGFLSSGFDLGIAWGCINSTRTRLTKSLAFTLKPPSSTVGTWIFAIAFELLGTAKST